MARKIKIEELAGKSYWAGMDILEKAEYTPMHSESLKCNTDEADKIDRHYFALLDECENVIDNIIHEAYCLEVGVKVKYKSTIVRECWKKVSKNKK